MGGYSRVNIGEIGCRPGEEVSILFEHLLDVALLSFGKGSSHLEEVALLFEWKLPCFPHGFEACFGVYSGV